MADDIPATDIALIAEALAAGRVRHIPRGVSGEDPLEWVPENGGRLRYTADPQVARSRWAFGKAPKETIIRDVKYPSRHAAAKALGVSHAAVSEAAKLGRLDTVGLRKKGRGDWTAPKETIIRDRKYTSQNAAAKALGVSQSTVSEATKLGRLDTVGLRKKGRGD
jgi:predicted DNA-binding protein (UPF0251 family)